MYTFLKQEKNEKGFYTSFVHENEDVLTIKSAEPLDAFLYLKKLNDYKICSEVFSNKYLTLSKKQIDYIFENSKNHENAEVRFTEFLPKFEKNVIFKNGKKCKLFYGLSIFENISSGGDLRNVELYFLKIYVDEKNENNLHLFSMLKNRFNGENCFQFFKNVFETTIFLTGNSIIAVQKTYGLWPNLRMIKGEKNEKQ